MALRLAVAALAAAACLAAAGAARAAEPECPRTNPRVEVALDDPDPPLRLDEGMDDLRAEAAVPGGAGPRGATRHHLGATVSRVEWQSEVEARIAKVPGRACARPDRVSLNIRHTEHSLRIARELPRGSCLFRETEAHERRHAAVNRATLRRAAAEVEGAVRKWAASAAGRGATEDEAVAALQSGLRAAIAPAMEAMQAARDAAHRSIDRPEEYRRLGRVCPEDQKALRERLRRARTGAD